MVAEELPACLPVRLPFQLAARLSAPSAPQLLHSLPNSSMLACPGAAAAAGLARGLLEASRLEIRPSTGSQDGRQ
jgi:hypothetical protein